jgi:hypothetical protein
LQPEFLMRALPLIAATLVLAACGKNDQSGTVQNADQGLTAESIVSNDVTAIDAVTGDAANMAADVDVNFGNLDVGNSGTSNEAKPSRPAPGKSAPTRSAPPAEANAAANTITNAE